MVGAGSKKLKQVYNLSPSKTSNWQAAQNGEKLSYTKTKGKYTVFENTLY